MASRTNGCSKRRESSRPSGLLVTGRLSRTLGRGTGRPAASSVRWAGRAAAGRTGDGVTDRDHALRPDRGAVRMDVRRLSAGHAHPPRRRARPVHRGRLRRTDPVERRPAEPDHHVPVHQPADGSVLRRGRGAGRHARDPPHRRPAGARLGGVDHGAAVRGADRHQVHADAPAGAPGADVALCGGPRGRRGRVPGARFGVLGAAAAGAFPRHDRGRAGGERGPECPGPGGLRRQHGHARGARRDDDLPRRERRGRPVLHRRRALHDGRGRGLRGRRRRRHGHAPDRRADQGRLLRVAAARGRRLDHGRRVVPAAGGRLPHRPHPARSAGSAPRPACR